MNSTYKLLLIPFLALLFIFSAIDVLAAEDDSNDKPDDEKTFICIKEGRQLICTCHRGEGTCADMAEICKVDAMTCTVGGCTCEADEDKLRETGSQFDELKSKIDPQSPAVENAPTEPVIHDHRSPKIDGNSNNSAEIVAPNNRTGTVRVKRTRPSSSQPNNAPAPIVTDHR
jgi:hypothetical protein